MADAEVATKAAEDVAPSSTVDSVEVAPVPPPASEPAAAADLPPPTVNGVAEPVPDAVPVAVAAVPADTADEAPLKSYPSIGAPRIDVTDDSEKTSTSVNKYELHDKETEAADRVAAALKSARLQVTHSLLTRSLMLIRDNVLHHCFTLSCVMLCTPRSLCQCQLSAQTCN